MFERIEGLVAAPFTPMNADGSLNLAVIPDMSKLLQQNGVGGVFLGGTTGESLSLSTEERIDLAACWNESASKDLKVLVHAGHTSLQEAVKLAAHAEAIGAWGCGIMAPPFLKPQGIEELASFCQEIAAACPSLPFYYYHIPSLTGVDFSMEQFLIYAEDKIPNLAGMKYTHNNFVDYQLCKAYKNGRFDMLYGFDELMICGLALGAKGFIGSTYNFLAPLYCQVIEAFDRGDLEAARDLQTRSMRIVQVLFKWGNPINVGKAIMKIIGLDCGPVRLPLSEISDVQSKGIEKDLREIDFFEYCSK